MKSRKPYWKCPKSCPICEGAGRIVVGMEGFVNSNLEQDTRDVYEPCDNAELIEPEYE